MVLVISTQYQEKCMSYPKQEELIIFSKYAIVISTINNGMVIVTKNYNYRVDEIK